MDDKFSKEQLTNIPLVPVRGLVVFPYMLLPLYIGRESSIKAIDESIKKNRFIFLSTQKDSLKEVPKKEDIYSIGTVCMIMRTRHLPDGRMKVLVQGMARAEISNIDESGEFFKANVEKLEDHKDENSLDAQKEIVEKIKAEISQMIDMGLLFTKDILNVVQDIQEPGQVADLLTSHLGFKIPQMQNILECLNVKKRLETVHTFLCSEKEVLQIQNQIKSQNEDDFLDSQKDQFLKHKLKGFGSGGDDKSEEIKDLYDKIEKANPPQEVLKEAQKQLKKLEKILPESSEASIVRSYLETIAELPWDNFSEDSIDLKKANEILDKEHYGLEKAKERIIEFLAVRKLNKNAATGPILCFSGPPGVGKTSLGKSIAESLGRKYHRIALGGLKDEAEIRGHRRTYVGAMPGKIIQALRQVGTKNPVFVLDEIDKLGSDYKGDPSSAMLEVLDPEQNANFKDHYLNLEFDLSNVLFIATANVLEQIPHALKDRLEIVQIPGYTENEKLKISKKHLMRKQIEKNGLEQKDISFTDEGLSYLISHYTRESGLRNLERQIGSLCRKCAKEKVLGNEKTLIIDSQKVTDLLGAPIFLKDQIKDIPAGVSTGLAWTQSGGEVLYVESIKIPGKGDLILTGQLGDVMKESARAAFSFIKSNSHEFNIHEKWFDTNHIHIHLPQGAIPKDGPSAGVTMASSMLSLITSHPVRKDIAMTGEITLTGRVLPVGGIREKTLAALNHGIKNVILPKDNEKDVVDIPEEYRNQINFFFVSNLTELFKIVLETKSSHTKSYSEKRA